MTQKVMTQKVMRTAGAAGGVGPGRGSRQRIDMAPDARLRPLLARPYRAYPVGHEPSAHRSVPAGMAVQLVVKLADGPRRPPEFLVGARDRHLPIDGPCAPSYIELSLDPLGAYTVLGAPGAELANALSDLSDVIGARDRGMLARMREVRSWRERRGLLDAFLLHRVEVGRRPLPAVRRAWSLLLAGGGTTPIGEIAADVGWSHKHLITKFTHHVGVTPKVAGRLIRFDRAHRHLLAYPHTRLSELAVTYGYADQSHFQRDFRDFAGATPAAYLRTQT